MRLGMLRAVAAMASRSGDAVNTGSSFVSREHNGAPPEAVSLALLPLTADGTALLRAGQQNPLSIRLRGPGGTLVATWA